MRAVVLRKSSPISWMLMPAFSARIKEFDRKYTVDGNATNIADLFESAFANGDNRMLGVALFTQRENAGPQLHGHLVAGVDAHHGQLRCVIYQYEKDPGDDDPETTNDAVQAIVDAWVQVLGQREIAALATSPARAKHFEKWGYRFSSILVTRSVGDGRQEGSDEFDEHADSGVAPGNHEAVPLGNSN